MHFDLLVPTGLFTEEQVYKYGREYLALKGQDGQPLSTSECRFCHIEEATASITADISRQGYSIIEMQGCNETA